MFSNQADDKKDSSPLMRLAYEKKYEELRLALQNDEVKKYLLQTDKFGNTILHYLLSEEKVEDIKDILENIIKMYKTMYKKNDYLYIKNKYDLTPWDTKNSLMFKILIELETTHESYANKINPLTELISNKELGLINELCDHKLISSASLFYADVNGNTPLNVAARLGLGKILAKLLLCSDTLSAHFAIMSKINTWLHQLVKEGAESIIHDLHKMNLINLYDLNSPDQDGNTPLHIAAYKCDSNMIKLLLSKNSPEEFEQDGNNNTWYHILTEKSPVRMINMLSEFKFTTEQLNVTNDCNETILHIAAKKGNEDLIIELINFGVDFSCVNNKKQSILHLLACNNHFNIIGNLLRKNLIDHKLINLGDRDGLTILHYLLKFNEPQLAEQILNAGGDLYIKDKRNLTPMLRFYEQIAYSNTGDHLQRINQINASIENPKLHINLEEFNTYIATKDLYTAFGGRKLIDLANLTELYDGGNSSYAPVYLHKQFNEFITKNYAFKSTFFSSTITTFGNFKQDIVADIETKDLIDDIYNNRSFIMSTGSSGHLIVVTVERSANDTVISIAERGMWCERKDDKQCYAIRSLRFPLDKTVLEIILNLLIKSNVSEPHIAKDIIFNKIPKEANSRWEPKNSIGKEILGKPFKSGICFWANPKTILRDLLVKQFEDINEGTTYYKEFDIYLREKALNNYISNVPLHRQDEKLIRVCQDIIVEKKKKLSDFEPKKINIKK